MSMLSQSLILKKGSDGLYTLISSFLFSVYIFISFLLLTSVKTSYPMDTDGSVPWDKAAGA
jgi:hypothetical protein